MALGANSFLARSRTMDWIMSCSSVSLKDMVMLPFCGLRSLAAGYWFLAAGYWLLVIRLERLDGLDR
jgi:hypothetical protein